TVSPRSLAIVAGIAASLGGCGTGATGTFVVGCPASIVTGTLEPLGARGVVGLFDGERHLQIDWHGGVKTAELGGRTVVIDPTGRPLAGVGDVVELLGGETRPGVWFACDMPFRSVAAPS